jgi:lipopolysaccharide export system permease protein
MPKIIDRYLILLFLKVLLVCFFSLAGLSFVIDFSTNADEFIGYIKREGFGVLPDYYLPRSLLFFDRTAGLLALVSAIFAITVLQRSNEFTALMAAGVSRARVVFPLMAAACIVALLGAANREFGLPRVRDKLARNAQDWMGERSKKCTPRYDPRTDVLISGKATFANERRIQQPIFRLPPELSAAWGRQIAAENAYQQRATASRPAGYLLRGVKQPTNLPKLKSEGLTVQASEQAPARHEPVLISPADADWLKPDECFVVSTVGFEQLTMGGSWRQFLTSYELFTGIRGQKIEPGADVRLMLHMRLIQPLLDVSLVLLGVPLVLTRGSRNIFLAGGIGAAMATCLLVVVLICRALGVNYLLDATIAAWLPLLIFGPMAYVLARPIWD